MVLIGMQFPNFVAVTGCCYRLLAVTGLFKQTDKTAINILVDDTVGDIYLWNLVLSIYTPRAFRWL